MVYAATKADGTDVLEYPKSQIITINGLTTSVISHSYDLTGQITNTPAVLNALNGKQ